MEPRHEHVLVLGVVLTWLANGVDGGSSQPFTGHDHHDQMRKMQAFKSSLTRRESASGDASFSPSPSPGYFASAPAPAPEGANNTTLYSPNEYKVTLYGADPSGKRDSTAAILKALSDAASGPRNGNLINGIANLGGAFINLEGGNYLISQPLRFPVAGVGNLVISGGTLRASYNFSKDGFLIDLSAPPSQSNSSPAPPSSYSYEFVTLRDLMLDCNFRGGGISAINALRTSIDNCYIAHFETNGILVRDGHETYIRNSFLGQHITAGGDPGERSFSGMGITLAGNDNAVTDTVIFSAAVGIMISGQANTLSGVHCYNKATGFGGTGIYLKLPGYTQTRIINCYMDYTGIVAEDPVQLTITNSFFLGDAFVLLKSINGIANGVNIVDNMFSGSNKGINIVQLDQSKGPFKQIEHVVVDRNNVKGMHLRATVARGKVQGNGTSWEVDFRPVLLFPNHINHVQYSLSTSDKVFPSHALRNISDNRVTVETNVAVAGSIYVAVDQGVAS